MWTSNSPERRASERLRVFFGARIPGDDLSPPIECHIRSFSYFGARLSPDSARKLPPRFDLRIDKQNRTYRAEIVWQADGDVGVRFIKERRLAPVIAHSAVINVPRQSIAKLREIFHYVEQE